MAVGQISSRHSQVFHLLSYPQSTALALFVVAPTAIDLMI
jgi:hypothetical protein